MRRILKLFVKDYYDKKKLIIYPVPRAVQGRKNVVEVEDAIERANIKQLKTLEVEVFKFLS